MEKFSAFIKEKALVIIPLAILLLTVSIGLFVRHQAEQYFAKFIKPLEINDEYMKKKLSGNRFTNKPYKKQIEHKFDIAQEHKNHHKIVAKEMYRFRLATVAIVMNFSIISVILVFFIGQKGWANTDPRLKAAFITVAAITAGYGYSSSTFGQAYAVEHNIKGYLCYDNIQLQAFDLYFQPPTVDDTVIVNALKNLDTQIAKCNEFHLMLQEVRATSEDVLGKIGQ